MTKTRVVKWSRGMCNATSENVCGVTEHLHDGELMVLYMTCTEVLHLQLVPENDDDDYYYYFALLD